MRIYFNKERIIRIDDATNGSQLGNVKWQDLRTAGCKLILIKNCDYSIGRKGQLRKESKEKGSFAGRDE